MTALARRAFVMMAALLTAGCASVPETRFYTLSVRSEPSEDNGPATRFVYPNFH